MKQKKSVALIGSGWRAQIFLRILLSLPGTYSVAGVISRSEENRSLIRKKWSVPAYALLGDLLEKGTPDFVIIAVAKDPAPRIIAETVRLGLPVLAETPPAPDLETLTALNRDLPPGARVQVAEQYHLYPMHRARLAVAASGVLGPVHYAQISVSHGYHGISLLRRTLGIGFENGIITARTAEFPMVEGPGRMGPPEQEKIITADHTLGILSFGNKTGLYDFERNQHRSWIRSSRFLLRGERGEINEDRVRYLRDHLTPVEYDLQRLQAGEYENVEGFYLRGVLGEGKWLFRNPWQVSFCDEDVAIAEVLARMGHYLETGESFYSLAEASQDQYLALMLDKAAETGKPVETETQCWTMEA